MKKNIILNVLLLCIAIFSFNKANAQCGVTAAGVGNPTFYDAACGTMTTWPDGYTPIFTADYTNATGVFQSIAPQTTGMNSGQSSNFCFDWVQDPGPNSTGATIYLGYGTFENMDADGYIDADAGIFDFAVYDALGTFISNSTSLTGLTPGATYTACVSLTLYNYSSGANFTYESDGFTTLQSDDCQSDGFGGCVQNNPPPAATTPFNEGSIDFTDVYMAVVNRVLTCPMLDLSQDPIVCPDEDDMIMTAGPGCDDASFTATQSIDAWWEISASPVPSTLDMTAIGGGIAPGDLLANNPFLSYVPVGTIFNNRCADFPINLGTFPNSSCDPIYIHTHFVILDLSIDGNGDGFADYDPNCTYPASTVMVQPEPQSPILTFADCVYTFTGVCANDLLTLTAGATAGAVVTGDGSNVITYQPDPNVLIHDPATTLTISVTNNTNGVSVPCDAEIFTYPINAEPVATIAVAGSPFCEDDAAVDITLTPEPGELAFGTVTFTVTSDYYASEVSAGLEIDGVPTGPTIPFSTFPDGGAVPYGTGVFPTIIVTDVPLNTIPAPLGTYTVGVAAVPSTSVVVHGQDFFGDGWDDVQWGGTEIGTIIANGATSGGFDGTYGTDFYFAVPSIVVDYVIQGTASIAGPGTDNGPVVVGVTPQFDPAAAGPGEHALVYTYTDPFGCVDEVITYVDVYQKPGLTPAIPTCEADGDFTVTIPATDISTATWNAILDGAAVGSDLGNTPVPLVDNTHSNPVGSPYTNDGFIDGIATSFTVTTTAGTLAPATISADGNIVITDIPAGTTSITVTLASTEQPGCDSVLVINMPCICPIVTDDAGTYCDGVVIAPGNDLATWSAAVATANPTAVPVNSTILAVDGTTPPDGLTIDLTHTLVDACVTETQTQYIYHVCDNLLIGDASDDTYVLLGTYVATLQPATQTPADPAALGCEVTLVPECANDVMAVAAVPNITGGAVAAQFNAVTGVYTAMPGDAAGTIDIEVTNEFGCGPVTYTLATPACILSPTCNADNGDWNVGP